MGVIGEIKGSRSEAAAEVGERWYQNGTKKVTPLTLDVGKKNLRSPRKAFEPHGYAQ